MVTVASDCSGDCGGEGSADSVGEEDGGVGDLAAAIVVIVVGGCNVGRGHCSGGSSNGGVVILMAVVRLATGRHILPMQLQL